jgi:Spy/CpxP family protein refolding chaperone
VALRLWGGFSQRGADEGGDTVESLRPVGEAVREYAAALAQPFCGPSGQPEVASWFGPAASHVRSVAFMALRDLPQEDRAQARDKVSADMRARISAMLTPAQRSQYQQMLAQAPGGSPPAAGARPAPAGGAEGADASKKIAGNDAATRAAGQKPASSATTGGGGVAAGGAAAPALPANGNPMVEFRNRLVAELALSPAQAEKVDAIYAEARPRFMALRDMSAEERPKARERISADIRARIADVLSAEQKPKYAALLAAVAGRQSTRGRIYLMGADGKPVAYAVRLGISDGSSTELLLGPNAPDAAVLKEGAPVIVGTLAAGTAPSGAPTGPRLPF